MSKILDPPYVYFSGDNVEKHTKAQHYIAIQQKLTERAIELMKLDVDYPPLILDIGCGSGIGGEMINGKGGIFVGVDIAPEMLMAALEEKDVPYNSFVRCDAGAGVPFRPGVFDGAVGIDVLRWILQPIPEGETVPKRLRKFFESVHGSLCCGGKAIFNFHPDTPDQAELLSSTATMCGFAGGIQIDFPNSSKAKVHWLVLEVGGAVSNAESSDIVVGCRNVESFQKPRHNHEHKGFNKKEWIIKKKERQRLLGVKVAHDSKYTGRSRRRWI